MTQTDMAVVPAKPVSAAVLWSYDERTLIKDQIAKGCTDLELELFAKVCQRTGLDPFARQIYAIKRGDKMTIQTGIDGYRLSAARSGDYAGSDDVEFDTEDAEHPNWARATVYRIVHGQRAPFTAKARWSEYHQEDSKGNLTSMWKKFPYLMLGKCAEALALRKAFPAELSGMYTDEEMSQADTTVVEGTAREVPQQENHTATTQRAIPAPKPTLKQLQDRIEDLRKDLDISKPGLIAWCSDPSRRYSSRQFDHCETVISALQDEAKVIEIRFHDVAQQHTLAAQTLLAIMRKRTGNADMTIRDAYAAYEHNRDEWEDTIHEEQTALVNAS